MVLETESSEFFNKAAECNLKALILSPALDYGFIVPALQ